MKQREDQERDRLQALKREFEQEPAADESGVTAVTFRVPSGQKIQRRFRETDTVETLYQFIETKRGEDETGFEDK